MFRRFTLYALAALLLAGATLPPGALAAPQKGDKLPTAEQVAETVILTYGGRERLAQIRRSGVERGRLMRTNGEGAPEEITYARSFLRGESVEKDKVRLDQKKPTLEYSLIFNEGRVWGLVKGSSFTPRQEEVDNFLAQSRHGLDALLRYKENGSALTLVGKEKLKNIEMWVLDVADKEQRRTRFYISATPDIRKIGRVFWLEYEEAAGGAAKPVKFRRSFHDYRVVQGTRVPYKTVLFADDRQVEEIEVLTVTYGIKMENSLFTQETDATASGGF